MATVLHMIDALGGVRKTAAALGVPPTTVQHWKNTNAVPSWREAALIAAFTTVRRQPTSTKQDQAA